MSEGLTFGSLKLISIQHNHFSLQFTLNHNVKDILSCDIVTPNKKNNGNILISSEGWLNMQIMRIRYKTSLKELRPRMEYSSDMTILYSFL